MSQLSDFLKDEIKRILPGLRAELESEFYKRMGLLPCEAFYSDNRVLRVFTNEAGKYYAMLGHDEDSIENLCNSKAMMNEEHRKTIYKIATLVLVQLAMW